MSLNLNTTSGDTYSGWDVGQVLLRLSNTAETLQDNADGWLRLANDTERCITGLLTDILAENERYDYDCTITKIMNATFS